LAERCFGCMQLMPQEANICPSCGFSAETYQAELHHLLPGTLLQNRFVIGKVLGEGGFGITYVGYDTRLSLKVAIKEFFLNGCVGRVNTFTPAVQISFGSNGVLFERMKQRFLDEATVLAQFSEESGIVTVRDFFQENSTAYIVMSFLSGETLLERLKREGSLHWEQTLDLFRPVLESLSIVHKHHMIHRDISPDNIMLTDRHVKLIDFGAAREFSEDAPKSLSVILKPGYAPEEQYRSHGKQGPWTDVYALCATMYRCLTGITPDDALERVMDDRLRPPHALCDCPAHVSRALMTGLSVRAADRFQTVDELYAALISPPQPEQPLAAEDVASGSSVPPVLPQPDDMAIQATINVAAMSGGTDAPEPDADAPPTEQQTIPAYPSKTQQERNNPSDSAPRKPIPEFHAQTQKRKPTPEVRPQTQAAKPERTDDTAKHSRKKTNKRFPKKLFLYGIAAVLVLVLCFLSVYILFGFHGECGDQAEWSLSLDGVLTISGSGAIDHYSYLLGAPWYRYRKLIKQVIISDGITEIGNFAFTNCVNLKQVDIPDSVTKIGIEAFYLCLSLLELDLPDGITSIDDSAFFSCDSLTELVIPDGVTAIEDSTFYGCDQLAEIVLPDGVTAIGDQAFYECSSLRKVTIPASVTAIGDAVCFGCSDELTIYGYRDSAAENYAIAKGYRFVALDDLDSKVPDSKEPDDEKSKEAAKQETKEDTSQESKTEHQDTSAKDEKASSVVTEQPTPGGSGSTGTQPYPTTPDSGSDKTTESGSGESIGSGSDDATESGSGEADGSDSGTSTESGSGEPSSGGSEGATEDPECPPLPDIDPSDDTIDDLLPPDLRDPPGENGSDQVTTLQAACAS